MLLFETIGATLGWTLLSVFLFYGGIRLYDFLDPIDYQAEIRKGNLAAGILLSAVIISLAAIIITVIIA